MDYTKPLGTTAVVCFQINIVNLPWLRTEKYDSLMADFWHSQNWEPGNWLNGVVNSVSRRTFKYR